MMNPIRIGVVGLGKIAMDAHLPTIAESLDYELAFLVDRHADASGVVPTFSSLDSVLEADLPFDAVALCTPPHARLELCERLVGLPCAILLEKPPFASVSAAKYVREQALLSKQPIFAAWHSRFAAQMSSAMAWARIHPLKRGTIVWRENPVKWHPGQTWLWQPGGLGVFDPGINALSMLTALYPVSWTVRDPRFKVPSNSQTPIAADFELMVSSATVQVSFEFHNSNDEVWLIRLEAIDGEVLELSDGGAALSVNGVSVENVSTSEYIGVYRRFGELVRSRQTEFDISPLEIVADAFLLAKHERVTPIWI